MLLGLDGRADTVKVDLARAQDRAGGGRRLPRARVGILDDPGQPFDEGAAQGLGDRPALAEGAFHEAGIPGGASSPSPQAPRRYGGVTHRGLPRTPTARSLYGW